MLGLRGAGFAQVVSVNLGEILVWNRVSTAAVCGRSVVRKNPIASGVLSRQQVAIARAKNR